ncbi:hypothetical protein GDO81_021461 [Engystomops pustulosus]|uniref:Uncharacterized protein n=1 Tax=Engystomops pustulosus TaxID=76066 RepID=A0AAV6ZA46_ENGPU|nr:hypothetical protein GDO81_021461 [Engystomops pustulosus]
MADGKQSPPTSMQTAPRSSIRWHSELQAPGRSLGFSLLHRLLFIQKLKCDLSSGAPYGQKCRVFDILMCVINAIRGRNNACTSGMNAY